MQTIDNRQAATEPKKLVRSATCISISIEITGMNPRHAIEELRAVGGKPLGIERDRVIGSIEILLSEDAMERIEKLLADGWDWA